MKEVAPDWLSLLFCFVRELTMTIAVFGSINMDIIAYSARLPKPGETIHGTGYKTGLGGKGANQAAAVARLGAAVAMIGRVGMDGFGQAAFGELAGYGVNGQHILRDHDNPTGIAVISVGEGGENVITIVAGANMKIDLGDVARAEVPLSGAKVLLLQLEVPDAAGLAAAAMVRKAGGTVILDPAPVPAGGIAPEFWHAADVLTPNETETAALTGVLPTMPDEGLIAARALTERGVGTAIVKLGARGVVYKRGAEEGFVPAFEVIAIDTVAAGDCFNGGLAVALAEGRSLPDAIRFASACGGLATTKKGAAAAAPSRAEVENLLRTGKANT